MQNNCMHIILCKLFSDPGLVLNLSENNTEMNELMITWETFRRKPNYLWRDSIIVYTIKV